jgi:hypothetical protein
LSLDVQVHVERLGLLHGTLISTEMTIGYPHDTVKEQCEKHTLGCVIVSVFVFEKLFLHFGHQVPDLTPSEQSDEKRHPETCFPEIPYVPNDQRPR